MYPIAYLCISALLNNECMCILNAVNPATPLGSLDILWPAEVDPCPRFELIIIV
jgi:hypothetical protein